MDINDIKEKSVKGVVALTSRTFILQLIALGATFVLTILLDPATFGIFYIVSAIINFLSYFSDIGLAAALVQKKTEPTSDDLATTFTIQQLLIGMAVILALVLSNTVARFFGFGEGGLWLYRALAVAFFLSSLKTIPSVILERALDFSKLVVPQIVETLVFYATAIVLAFKGYGVVSFAYAALFRGVIGTVLLFILVPWRPQILIRIESAKKLLSFGLPYQANSFLALIKDDLLTIFLGKILPFSAVGYIGWAKKWAEIALRLIMDNIIRVTFPTFSRLQHEPELLRKAVEKSLLFLSTFAFPIAIGMMFMISPLLDVVPRYGKWAPAVFPFYLFTISAVLATISSPFVNVLNATGRVRTTLYLMIFWTVLTWILVPISAHRFGFSGVAIASVLIGLTSFLPYLVVRRVIAVDFWHHISHALIATFVMAMVMFLLFWLIWDSRLRLILGIPLGLVTYALLTYIISGKELLPYFRIFTAAKKQY